jgi:dTDP-4-dehydrorhamnose 3,5-epimerase-like enzyme
MLARYVEFPVKGDDLGWLVAIEGNKNIPFAVQRVYYIFGTRAGVRRGNHAHHKLRQLMVCIAGSCKVLLDDGKQREEVLLDSNARGLFIDPMVWHEMFEFSGDCVLLVLADGWYDVADYIRDYGAFKALCGNAP